MKTRRIGTEETPRVDYQLPRELLEAARRSDRPERLQAEAGLGRPVWVLEDPLRGSAVVTDDPRVARTYPRACRRREYR